MIRGIQGIVQPSDLEVGCCYLDPGWGKGTTLFQCVQTQELVDGEPRRVALVLSDETGGDSLSVQALPYDNPLIALPPVSVRVDPPSAFGTARTQVYRAGFFLVDEGKPIVVAKAGYGYMTIDISRGRVVRTGHHWVALSRWSLVVDEAGEEVTIAEFGAD